MSWSRLQSASVAATSSAISSQSVTYGTNLTAGTVLIAAVAVSKQGGTATVATVKDAALNSFTKIGSIYAASLCDVSLWAIATPAGDAGTKPAITATLTGGGTGNISMLIQEISGTQAVADGTLGSVSGSGAGSTGSPVYSSTAASEYMVSVYGDDGGPLTWTKPAALTSDANSLNSQSFANVALAYGNSTGGAESASWSLTGSAAEWGVLLVAFKLPAPVSTRPFVVSQAVNRAGTY